MRSRAARHVAVFEVGMGMQRSGWVIARRGESAEQVIERLNLVASRSSFGVLCAELMRGYELADPRD
jgi:hypothetical protein